MPEMELGVEQPLGGVIEDGQARLARGGTEGEPGVRAPVEVQELAEAGAGLAAPPVPAARPAALRLVRTSATVTALLAPGMPTRAPGKAVEAAATPSL